MTITREDLANRFTYHPPQPGQPAVYEEIRYEARALASLMVDRSVPSREQSLAITALEEAVMWINASIARHGLAPLPDDETEDGS